MQQLIIWQDKAVQQLLGWRSRCAHIWQQLDLAQRCYLLSALLVVGWLGTFSTQPLLLGLLGVTLFGAVISDIWQGFVRIWHSLPGKAFILVCYAVLANFCFALADSSVNNLIGVRPEVVPFSVNLTLMLLAPFWSFLLAFALLTLYLLLHTIKVMLLLMLRPLGVRSHHILNGSYPKLSLMARLCFLPVVFMYMAAAMTGYLTGNTAALQMFQSEDAAPSSVVMPGTTDTPNLAEPEDLNINLFGPESSGIRGFNPEVPWINKTVAWFLYQVESLGKSQCLLQGDEHLVHLNDYEVLVITPDGKRPYGYRYQVRACGSPSLPDFTRKQAPAGQ
ncbi:hypothetical protein [Rheinheimera tilapiae]|uniref:Uncharacterized protein n=1 Tax=Rheinheimera tilapiae TaxID=875043 RepID=A0ABV6BAW8_9GAMM